MRDWNDRDDCIGVGTEKQVEGPIDVLGAAEWRRGLQQHQYVWLVVLLVLERCDQVDDHVDHRGLVGREVRWAEKRDFGSKAPGSRSDFLVVSGHNHSSETATGASGVHGVSDERPAAEPGDVLVGNPFGSSTGRNDAENVQYWIRFCTCSGARASTSAIRAPARPSP